MINAKMKVNPDENQQSQQQPNSLNHEEVDNSPEISNNNDINQINDFDNNNQAPQSEFFPDDDQVDQPEIQLSDDQDDQADQSESQPIYDNINQNNDNESTAYSHIPEKSQKQPLIIRLRNPPPQAEEKNKETSSKSTDQTQNANSADDIPDEDKWKCPICLDALQQPVVTRCGHVFCWPCIHEWLRRSNTCPVCHGEIEESHLIPIYGQGDEADISSPPPPKPEYREARPNNGFNFVFRTPFTTRNITDQVHTLFHSGPYLIIQIVAIVFLFASFYI